MALGRDSIRRATRSRLTQDTLIVAPVVRAAMPSTTDSVKSQPFIGFDQKVIAMYAGGMDAQGIQRCFGLMYGVDISRDSIDKIAKAALADVSSWQSRPLEPMYPVVFFERIPVKIRNDLPPARGAAHLDLAVLPNGLRDVLGVWIEPGVSKAGDCGFFQELRNRGVSDIFIAVICGSSILVPIIQRVFPTTTLHTAVLALIRQSLGYTSTHDRPALAVALRSIYTADTTKNGRRALDDFSEGALGLKYPIVSSLWYRSWMSLKPYFFSTSGNPPSSLCYQRDRPPVHAP